MIRKLVVVLLTGVICLVGVTSALAVTYNEAPMLRTMVAAGELPPVEERLPSEPLVIQPKDEIGKYGGTLVGIKHSPGNWYMIAHLNVEPLMELDPENALKIVPNIARDWEWNEDKSELTIYLRRGIRWSDGEPFTADDIAFQFEDVIFNEELNPVVPGTWIANGEPVKFTKVDDYTVSFNYNGPNNPSEIYKFTPTLGYDTLYLPAHYFKQFHIKYNPDADALAKEEDYDSWWQLFQEIYWKSLPYIHYPGPPYIYAWVPKTVTVERTVWERNPYYWKVDTAGNQLPYLDGMVGVLVVESELVKAKGIAGEFDFLVEGLTMDEVFLLNQNAEKNNYKVIIGPNTWAGAATYYVNQNHKDPVRRELFRNVDFRRALSLAINRDEINEMVFFGMGTPLLGIALGDEPFYDAEVRQAEKEAIRYDVDAANRLLDEIGLTERDKDGYRVTSDGEPLVLEIITSTGLPDLVKVPELVSAYWLDIGIKTTFKVMERTLRYLKRDAGELDVTVYITEPSALRYRTNPGRWSVLAWEWAPFWNRWYDSKGTLGEEPTGEAKRLFELGEMMPNADDDEWVSMGKEFLMNCIRNMWLIGTVGLPPRPMIFRKTLANLYEDLAWTNATAGNFRNRAYQWWFK